MVAEVGLTRKDNVNISLLRQSNVAEVGFFIALPSRGRGGACSSRFIVEPDTERQRKHIPVAVIKRCGGGIFHCPPRSHSRPASQDRPCSPRSSLDGVSLREKATLWLFRLLTHDLRRRKAAAGGRDGNSKSRFASKKENTPRGGVFFFGACDRNRCTFTL